LAESFEDFGETEGGFDIGLTFEDPFIDFADAHYFVIDGVEFGNGFVAVADGRGFEDFLPGER